MRAIHLLALALCLSLGVPNTAAAFPPMPKIKKPKIKMGDKKTTSKPPAASPAPAATLKMDAPSKRNLTSAQNALKKLKNVEDYKKQIPADFGKRVTNYFTDYRKNLEIAVRSYRGIKAVFHGMEDVKAVKRRIDSATAYIEVAGTNYDNAVAQKKENEGLKKIRRAAAQQFKKRNKESVDLHHHKRFLTAEPRAADDAGIQYLNEAKVKKLRAQAKALLANCQGTFESYGKTHKVEDAFAFDPDLKAACDVARDFEGVLKRGLQQSLLFQDQKSVDVIAAFKKRAAKGSFYLESRWCREILRALTGKWAPDADPKKVRRYETSMRALTNSIGVPIKEPLFPKREAALVELANLYIANAKGPSMPDGATFSDKSAAKAAKKWFHPSVKSLKIKTTTKDWLYNKNALGIPISRYKMGFVLAQGKGDKLCRLQGFKYLEPRNNGKYRRSDTVSMEGKWFLVKCR